MIDVIDKERQGLDPTLAKILDPDGQDEKEKAPKDYVFCAACNHVLTQLSHAMEINGSHAHICVNPHGFEFHLGSFREALGCSISGPRTRADSWFQGFKWRYASCDSCQQHLGWYFDQGDAYFYGLVFDRISLPSA